MSDNYTLSVVATLLTSTSTDRTKTTSVADDHSEDFWATVLLPAAASDTALLLNLLTTPKLLVVIGATGISFKLDDTGTDSIGADPIAVVGNESEGLDIDQILLSNSDAEEHSVTVIAME